MAYNNMALASSDNYTALVSNATVAATNAPAGIFVPQANEIWFAVRFPATSDPIGTINLTGSLNGTDYGPLNIADGAIGGLATGITWAAGTPATITINDPPAAASLLFGFDSPPRYVKIDWTRTSGGHSYLLNIEYTLKTV